MHVAVAYVGADWQDFIKEPERLKSVILSPTLGTNPYAVQRLAAAIGWDRVHFLNELHAKVFLGEETAVVGSSNLTRNGLSGEVLEEIGVEVSNASTLEKLGARLDRLRQQADAAYPEEKDKKLKIRTLKKLWRAAIANGAIRKPALTNPDFSEIDPQTDDFYVCWYDGSPPPPHSAEVKKLESKIGPEVHFTNTDPVERNKWVLMWRVTKEGLPHKREPPYWVYIHDFFRNGNVGDYLYKTCAVQWTESEDAALPPEPFGLTEDGVADAFRHSIVKSNIAQYLIQPETVPDDGPPFVLKKSFKGLPLLITAMKKELAAKKSGKGK